MWTGKGVFFPVFHKCELYLSAEAQLACLSFTRSGMFYNCALVVGRS